MEDSSSKISEFQLHQYRTMKHYEKLAVKHRELEAETDKENKRVEEERVKLNEVKELNVENNGSMQEQRK